MLFTGYTWEEIQHMSDVEALLACVDVLIAGRYDASQRLARGLRGSLNQTVHLCTDRYTIGDMRSVPAEVIITVDGHVITSGIEPALL